MLSDSAPRWLSRPVGVEWRGWRSDTLRLQRSGWQLAVETNFDSSSIGYRLAMKHEGYKLFAVTDRKAIQSMRMNAPWMHSEVPVFQVVSVLPIDFRICTYAGLEDLSEFKPIDAEPQFVNAKIQTIDDFNIFAVVGKAERVLVNKADMSVIEHLEAIKRLQADKQRELRKDEVNRKLHLVAQIVHEEAA